MRPLAIVTVSVIWLLFILGTAWAFLVGALSTLVNLVHSALTKEPVDLVYAHRNIVASDKAAAAALGWSGKKTISTECGDELVDHDHGGERPCRFCQVVCWILDWALEPDHCRKESSGR